MIAGRSSKFTALLAMLALLPACGGGGGGGGTTPPGGGGGGGGGGKNPSYTCPTSDDTSSNGTGGGSVSTESEARISFVRRGPAGPQYAPGLVAVTYDRSYAVAQASTIQARESALNVQNARTLDFPFIRRSTRILAVDPSRVQSVESSFRGQPGVISVAQVGVRRPMTATRYTTGNPYFDGFSVTVAPTAGATLPPPTNNDPPYYERNDVPGQWDAHATKVDYAFGYSQAGSSLPAPVPAALGSTSVNIAVIDTGQDTGHPELAGKFSRQRCFITDGATGVQSTSNFTTDPQGHGTDVAGIAAASITDSLGFAGAGGNVMLYGYRVFPTPDSYTNCSNSSTTDATCSALTIDIAAAINDAVSAGANVISMSLGGGGCTNGVDNDPTEGNAIENAIAANVIVVAAAGNAGASTVDAPGCDNGVLAVGATSLDDGTPNGSNHTGGTASSPIEYVASYSNDGSTNTIRSTASWGIVAPGGDPSGGTDLDDLHWIENIWPASADLYSPNLDGNCNGDYPNDTGTSDCRILIAGTSMATPRVAGAAALLLSVAPSLQSPAAMRAALCDHADNLHDPHQGCGRLNVYTSMANALGDPSPPTPVP
jgi:hypothetical protein